MVPLSEHYAAMLIQELSKPNTRLSSDTVEHLLRSMRTGGRGSLHLVNTQSEETVSESTIRESVNRVLGALDSTKDSIHSVLEELMEMIRLSTLCLGETEPESRTTTISTRNDDGPSESEVRECPDHHLCVTKGNWCDEGCFRYRASGQCILCPACNREGKCLGKTG